MNLKEEAAVLGAFTQSKGFQTLAFARTPMFAHLSVHAATQDPKDIFVVARLNQAGVKKVIEDSEKDADPTVQGMRILLRLISQALADTADRAVETIEPAKPDA